MNGATKVVSMTPFEKATADFKLIETYPANYYRGKTTFIYSPYCTDI